MSTSRPSIAVPRALRLVLWSSMPMAVGATAASIAGVLLGSIYAAESRNWATQAVGQDLVNLVIYPTLVVLAWRAARGSSRAYLGWLGLVAYTAYSYLLYAGFLHFSGWFLVYVAVWGLATYALIAGVALLEPERVRSAFAPAAPARGVGTVLVVLGGMFAALWLAEIVPASLEGTMPRSVEEAGLVTNPVWMLDLGWILPAMIGAGWLLRRRRPLGFTLAAPLLAFGMAMGSAIVGMQVMLWVRGESTAIAPIVLISAVLIAEAVALWRFLRALLPDASIGTLLRGPVENEGISGPEGQPATATEARTAART